MARLWLLPFSGVILVSYLLSYAWFDGGLVALLKAVPMMLLFWAMGSYVALERRPVIARQLRLIEDIERLGSDSESNGFALLQNDARLRRELDIWFNQKLQRIEQHSLMGISHWVIWAACVGGMLLGCLLRRVVDAGLFVCMGLWFGLAIYEANMNWRRCSVLWRRIAASLPQVRELELGYAEDYRAAKKKYGRMLAAFAVLMIVLFYAFVAFIIVWGVRHME